MANITVTTTGVDWTGPRERVRAGGTVTRGMMVSKTTSNTWVAANNTTAVLAGSLGLAVCLSDAAIGQEIIIGVLNGPPSANGPILTVGGTPLTIAVNYVLGDSAGGIAPVADVGSGEFMTHIGMALTTSTILPTFAASGVALG